MSNYTKQQKNQLFSKIQQYVQQHKLSLQNMVDLHDIMVTDKPSYSHNKNGTMYMSSKYSDKAFEKIEELIKWVDKQYNNNNTEIETSSLGEGVEGIPDSTESAMNDEKRTFGKDKRFKNTFGKTQFNNYLMDDDDDEFLTGNYKSQKLDVTKENETFKRLTKISKKRSGIPIHYEEKQLTSWDGSFNNKRNKHFSKFYFSESEDEDSVKKSDKNENMSSSGSDSEDESGSENDLSIYDEFAEDEEDQEDVIDLDEDIADLDELSEE